MFLIMNKLWTSESNTLHISELKAAMLIVKTNLSYLCVDFHDILRKNKITIRWFHFYHIHIYIIYFRMPFQGYDSNISHCRKCM